MRDELRRDMTNCQAEGVRCGMKATCNVMRALTGEQAPCTMHPAAALACMHTRSGCMKSSGSKKWKNWIKVDAVAGSPACSSPLPPKHK